MKFEKLLARIYEILRKGFFFFFKKRLRRAQEFFFFFPKAISLARTEAASIPEEKTILLHDWIADYETQNYKGLTVSRTFEIRTSY